MSDPDGVGGPLAAHPDPVLRYGISDGVPVVTATNDAFDASFVATDAAFGTAEATPVRDVFEEFDVVEGSEDGEIEERLVSGDEASFYLRSVGSGPAYCARVLPAETDGGFLVFADVSACRELSNRAGIDEVASAISHDLRNPLDVAGAHLQAARETGADEHFGAVADAHDRMEQIIQDVLTLARGDEMLDPSPDVSVRDAAEDAWQSVDTEDAELHFEGQLPTATADAERVQRLFENLFRNAVEHGSANERSDSGDAVEHGFDDAAETAARRGSDGDGVTVGALGPDGVYVADDGPGIPEGERDSVFAPGYTVGNGGTGLGLAIVKRIAEAHGWTVTITNGGGARIEIRFDS